MLLLGHRGAKRNASENTIEAFALALEHGCDGFEFDVRLSSDGVAVIVHDPRVAGAIVAQTPWKTLHHRLRLPTVEQVWQEFHRRAFLNVELKVAGAEEQLARLLRAMPPGRGCIVSSFLPDVVSRMNAVERIPLGYICDDARKLNVYKQLPVGYVMAHWKLVTPNLVSTLATEQKQLMVWTVNDADDMRRFNDLGVAGIISDDTQLLANVLRG